MDIDIELELIQIFSEFFGIDNMLVHLSSFVVEDFRPSLMDLYELHYIVQVTFSDELSFMKFIGCRTLGDIHTYLELQRDKRDF